MATATSRMVRRRRISNVRRDTVGMVENMVVVAVEIS